ncbi:MAG: GntR family transcriptional regulator [Burkholderiales bacterium]|jgi:DNA-binding GntR family transcriptional regulator
MDRSRTEATPAADDAPDTADDAASRTRRMYDSIVSALTEHRIAPGTRLREERLGSMFDVSRTQVRKVLQRLEHEGLVRREPNRGVTVAAPDADETRELFEARRLIEPWVVSKLCAHCARKDLVALRRIVRDEARAQADGDRRARVRLSGEFHRALARAAGNRAIAESMGPLTLRTCLAILANRAPTDGTCRDDEHGRLLEAIEAGDAKRASRLMLAHLEHIEASMEAPAAAGPSDDLEALFTDPPPAPARAPRPRTRR